MREGGVAGVQVLPSVGKSAAP